MFDEKKWHRLSYETIAEFGDDPFFTEAVYHHIMHTAPETAEIIRQSNTLMDRLFYELPKKEQKRQGSLSDAFSELHSMETVFSYGQGIALSMRFLLNLPLLTTDVPPFKLLRLSDLEGQNSYTSTVETMRDIANLLKFDFPAHEALISMCCAAAAQSSFEHAKFCFLWGFEYGLILIRRMNAEFREDETYIRNVYLCISRQDIRPTF